MLLWPAVALLGFVALIGVVVVLAMSTTARYERERNRADEPPPTTPERLEQEAAVGARSGASAATVPFPGRIAADGYGLATTPALRSSPYEWAWTAEAGERPDRWAEDRDGLFGDDDTRPYELAIRSARPAPRVAGVRAIRPERHA